MPQNLLRHTSANQSVSRQFAPLISDINITTSLESRAAPWNTVLPNQDALLLGPDSLAAPGLPDPGDLGGPGQRRELAVMAGACQPSQTGELTHCPRPCIACLWMEVSAGGESLDLRWSTLLSRR